MLLSAFGLLAFIKDFFFFFFPFHFLPDRNTSRFAKLVDTPKGMAAFREKYRIPNGIELKHCELGEWLVSESPEAVVIPIIAFIEGGTQILMSRVTRDFLINSRFCPN